MKTKLEVGKEYWLSEQKISRGIYLGESNSGNFDFRITLGSKHTKPLGELDVITSNLSVYSEYIQEKPWQFTTPIAMKCTEEQFNGIEDKLFDMGYKLSISCDLIDGIWLVNNFGGVSNCFGLACGTPFQKTKFNSFNPDLFLALAAMTDKEDGIRGEWWRYTDEMSDPIVAQKYLGEFTVPNKSWRKATAQEIIEHFEKKEFVLPYAYMVCVNSKEEYLSVLEYARTKGEFKEDFNDLTPNIFPYYIGMEKNGSWTYNDRYILSCDGVKITFDQFKKYVLKETEQSCQVIPIPPSKQATLFDDRVEITDWKPKEGQLIYYIIVSNFGNIKYRAEIYNSLDYQKESLANGFIKRTESEAKQLVEKLKQAML